MIGSVGRAVAPRNEAVSTTSVVCVVWCRARASLAIQTNGLRALSTLIHHFEHATFHSTRQILTHTHLKARTEQNERILEPCDVASLNYRVQAFMMLLLR